ncbi:MAG: hypothetical protein O7D91_13515 [Planctomycetota bacterium]|nr:hypothetical protein [Planctomycetota bacterium]
MSAPFAVHLYPLANEVRLLREIVCDHLRDVVKANRGKIVRLPHPENV